MPETEQPSPTPPISEPSSDGASAEPMNDDQLAEAKRYSREELVCELVDKAIDLIFLSVFALVAAITLDEWLVARGITNLWGRLALMYLIMTVLHFGVSFPLSIYSGYFLEHKFQLSKQSLGQWIWKYAKGAGLTLIFGLLMAEGLFVVIKFTGNYWWLAAAATFFLISVVLGQLAPVLILPLFYKIERFDDEALGGRLAQLAAGTGLSIEGVYRMKLSEETVKANAMLAGMGKTRRVIMGDTLLDSFSREEIEVVFAHEIGHHVHRHIRSLLVFGAVMSVAGFLVCHGALAAWTGNNNWPTDLPVYALPMFTLVTTIFFLVFAPLQNGISRHFERQSDRYALERTGNGSAYRSAFTKLAKLNKDDPDPHPLEVFWLHSHPPISERLAMADRVLP